MTRCAEHRLRYRRLWRLPSVRATGTVAVATVTTAAAAAILTPPWAPVAVLAAGAAVVAAHVRRNRDRVVLEIRMVRALRQSGAGCPGEINVPGLTAEVRAESMSTGVTRIHAGSWLDAVCALGYVMGRDRGFHLDLLRRTASGRLAEVLGTPAVPTDRSYRPLGLTPAAARAAGALAEPEREALTAFAAGVNAVLRHDPPWESRFLSYRLEPWSVADSLLVGLFLFHALSWQEPAKRADAVIRRALPAGLAEFLLPGVAGAEQPIPEGLTGMRAPGQAEADIVAVDRAAAGSNCWIHRGPAGPVLACDLHLPLFLPNLLYEVDLRWSGQWVRGLAAPGLPVVLTGTNGRLVWGMTNLGADVLDLVPATGASAATERIRVRGHDDVVIPVTRARELPVSPDPLLGNKVAIRWTGHDPRAADLRLQRIARVTTVGEAVAVLDAAQGVALNVLLADDSGHMAHLATGLLPRRRGGEPDGYLTGRERPRRLDPLSGTLVSANDSALAARPFRICYDPDPGYRARRIRDVLANGADTGPAGMRALQHDTAAGLYLPYRDLAVSALAAIAGHKSTVDLLASWDGTAAAGSRAFGVLVRLREILAQRVLAPYLSECRRHDPTFRYPFQSVDRPLLTILSTRDPSLLPPDVEAGGWARFVASCVDRALADLGSAGRAGRLPAWGALNSVGLVHPLAALAPWAGRLLGIAPRPQPGALHSVRTCVPGFGAAGRAVLSPGSAGVATFELPGGQSGHPLSVHFADRHEEWARNAPRAGRAPRVGCEFVLRPTGMAGAAAPGAEPRIAGSVR